MKYHLLLSSLFYLYPVVAICMEEKSKITGAAYYIIHHHISCEKSDGKTTSLLVVSKNECRQHQEIMKNKDFQKILEQGKLVVTLYRHDDSTIKEFTLPQDKWGIYSDLNAELIAVKKMLNKNKN